MRNDGDAEGPSWRPPPRPDWVQRLNDEGRCMDLRSVVPLDEESLCGAAMRRTGLHDFGDERWREPFRVLIAALDTEAELTLTGRLMARSDLLIALANRLAITEAVRRDPQIVRERIAQPIFITGLARSGTSFLYEVMAQDPDARVPLSWEALLPCPPPTADTYETDPRIARAHRLITQSNRVVPEFASVHELSARLPWECGLIMINSFISDFFLASYHIPSYAAWVLRDSWAYAYAYHRQVLQILQWKNRRRQWLLKAPNHQEHLPTLLAVYPDARLIQTHRDPIVCMSSVPSLLGYLHWMRSDRPFDATAFERITIGTGLVDRLDQVTALRDSGAIPAAAIADVRYQDLLADPIQVVRAIYAQFSMPLSEQTERRMRDYVCRKPQDKFGRHAYGVATSRARERPLFEGYQRRYGVPSEV
jgi:hypothetical protein